MKAIFAQVQKMNHLSIKFTRGLDSIALMFLRLYASWIFLPAGWLKIKDWDTTLFLFEEEYQVPFYRLKSPLGRALLVR